MQVFGSDKHKLLGLGLVFFAGACFSLFAPAINLASTLGAYAGDWNGRAWALLAGLLCGFGNGFQFMGGQAAGYAAADAVQVLARRSSISEFQSRTVTATYMISVSHCQLVCTTFGVV